ncbi:MAG: DUF58 domain-containing protein [Deltaproteobacteria bacterium]|nr:MAG: DUF58 domain-containing protein [Deltaproteobacteria bacterium]
MLTAELIRRIRRIEITTRRAVEDVLAGQYHSVFKGRGMVFDEVRPYQPGDDIRVIDWNVTARMNDLFVKQFIEERELTVMLLVDASGSQAFGSRGRMKNELAAELSGLLAYSAIKNNDRVGLIIFSDQVEKFVPPKKGRKHVLRVISEVLSHRPRSRGTDIAGALQFLSRVSRRKSVAFLLSDFLAEGFATALKVANRRHDLVCIRLIDPLEESLPGLGLVSFQDAESGRTVLFDTTRPAARRQLSDWFAEQRQRHTRLFRQLRLDSIDLYTNQDYLRPLVLFFQRRASRR